MLRERGHRVAFVIESFAGNLEAQGFEERLMRLSPPPEVEEEPGQFWKDFIRDTAPVFRKPTFLGALERLLGNEELGARMSSVAGRVRSSPGTKKTAGRSSGSPTSRPRSCAGAYRDELPSRTRRHRAESAGNPDSEVV